MGDFRVNIACQLEFVGKIAYKRLPIKTECIMGFKKIFTELKFLVSSFKEQLRSYCAHVALNNFQRKKQCNVSALIARSEHHSPNSGASFPN